MGRLLDNIEQRLERAVKITNRSDTDSRALRQLHNRIICLVQDPLSHRNQLSSRQTNNVKPSLVRQQQSDCVNLQLQGVGETGYQMK